MIKTLATIMVALIAIEHSAFLAIEMFFWDHEIGRNAFKVTAEFTSMTKVLAANQGLYNGFLAAGLLWGLTAKKQDVVVFFLACVLVAGLYGGWSFMPKIYFVQALPAAVALGLTFISGTRQPSGS